MEAEALIRRDMKKEKEVVINRCYGGFSLSALATKELAKRKGKDCYFFVLDSIFKGQYRRISAEEADSDKTFICFAYTVPNPDAVLLNNENWYSLSLEERKKRNALSAKYSLGSRRLNRADKDLVAVVKKLKEAANGKYAKLEIVKIPADVKFTIEEYDGMEHVAEAHRTW